MIRTVSSIFLLFALAACGTDENNSVSPMDDVGPQPDADVGVPDSSGEDAGQDANAEPDADEAPTGTAKLFAQGPFPVGFVEFEVSYSPPGAAEARTLPVKAWYPAAEGTDAEAVVYRVAGIVEVASEAALDAPQAADGQFPVVVYSHGSGGEGLLGYPYGENFASWGWVVVSANHVGNTALDGVRGEFAPFAQNLLYRVTDISALLDAVAGGATGTPLDGHGDAERAFLFGHSFGGYTTLAAGGADFDYDGLAAVCPTPSDDGSCAFLAEPDVEAAFRAGFGDERIDAIVAQAPALVQGFAEGAVTGLGIPTMIQSGDLDTTTPNATEAEPAWNALDGASDVWLRLATGGHFTFISICYDLSPTVLAAFRPTADAEGCGPQFVDAQVALPVLNAYLRAFAETHVLGSAEWSAVLNGTEPLGGEEFSLTTK